MIYNNILETIGNTPLVKLNHLGKDLQCNLFAWCQEKSVQLTYIGVVSDITENDQWKPGFHEIKDSLGQAHRLAYEALVKKGQ